MVFESVLTYFLNKYLGPFVENLDTNQLNIGIWGGNVELKNLILKQGALDALDLPIQTVFGKIGKLALKIPWKNLYGAEFLISLEDIYLLAEPNLQVKYDAVKEAKRELDSKLQQLLQIENAKKLEDEKDKPQTDYSFVEKLSIQIAKNIKLSIKNIHIRYEDKVTRPEHPFSVGITLKQLEVVSTDEEWNPALTKSDITKIFKILELEGLSIYWNTDSAFYGNLSIEDLCTKLPEGIESKNNVTNNKFILGPINATARIKINQKPELDNPPFIEPSIQLNFDMQKLFIGVSRTQYYDIIALADSMSLMSKGEPFRKYRPVVDGYKGHYKQWWHFAYTCILESEVRRKKKNWDWNNMKQHRELCQNYKGLYLKKITNKATATDFSELEECERKLDVTNIVIIRNRTDLEQQKKATQTSKKGWLSWMWGGSTSTEDDKSDLMKMVKEVMTPEEKTKMYKAIGYQENATPAIFPEEFIQYSLLFVLRSLEVSLFDDTGTNVTKVLNTELSGVKSKIETRPAKNGLRLHVKIDDFRTFGMPQGENYIPEIMSSNNKDVDLLEVNFEINPLNSSCDQRIHVSAEPLKIVYDAQTIIKITEIFTVPQSSAIDEVAAIAGAKMQDVSQKTATGLQYAIDKRIQLDLNLCFKAPIIIIPYGGIYTDNENVLVVNLGNIKMYSLPRALANLDVKQMHQKGNSKKEILQNILDNCYDEFKIELTDLQVLVAQSDENWKESVTNSIRSPMHLLNPLNLNVSLAQSLIVDDSRIPLLKFSSQLPSVDINISDSRILLLLTLISSIPLPGQNTPSKDNLMRSLSKSSTNIMAAIQELQDHSKENISEVNVGLGNEFVQFIKLLANFEMSELSITINQQESLNSEITELVKFKLEKLNAGLMQKTYETNVTLNLGGISLQQKRQNSTINIISTKSVENDDQIGSLFKLNFIQADVKCPEFHNIYKSCEQQLIVQFGTLSVVLHQEGLLSLIAFATNLQELMSEVQENKKPQDRIATASDTNLSVITDVKKRLSSRKKPVVVQTIKFKLNASFKELTVLFATDAAHISLCAIRGIKSKIIMKETYTQVTAKLQELAVVDLNSETSHKLILKSVGEETISLDLVLNNIEKSTEDVPDMILHCSVGAVRIVFLNWFVTNMLNFLNNFQAAQQSIVEASQAAASTAKENMKNAYQKAIKIVLNVNLKAPIIVIPTDSRSYIALYVDLGNVTLSNKFTTLETKSEDGFPAVIDDLSAKLTDLKISQVFLNEDGDIAEENNVLMPLTTTFLIRRNLSAGWYNIVADIDISVHIKLIDIILRDVDYKTIMSILNGNLAEGNQIEKLDDQQTVVTQESVDSIVVNVDVQTIPNKNIHEFLKFTFVMDTFNITLLTASSAKKMQSLPTKGLGGFELQGLSMKGRILTDQSLAVSILLMDCVLTDIRDGREGKLNKLIHKSRNETNIFGTELISSVGPKSMIDLTFQKKGNDVFGDIRIFSITIILSVDYLLKLSQFFAVDQPVASSTTSKTSVVKAKTSVSAPVNTDNQMQLTVNFKLEKPDIVLVENMDDINAKAIILNNELLVKYRSQGEHQVVNGTITDLTLFTSVYNPAIRESMKKYMLNPVTISLAGSTPNDQGLHLELIVTEFKVNISPAIIELFTRVLNTATQKEDTLVDISEIVNQYDNLWDEKPFDENDYWFLKPEEATEITEDKSIIKTKDVKDEICLITLNSITVTLEVGVGRKTLPLILLETSLIGKIKNWSSQLQVEASLSMEIGYYNSHLALWEPLMEPVTKINQNNTVTFKPWELLLEMSMNEQDDVVGYTSNEDIQSLDKPNSVLSIDIKSEDNLELTVTKTCLEVITTIGNSFASAMQTDVIGKNEEEAEASFKVINETGLVLTLNLKDGPFEETSYIQHEQVVLENGAVVYLQLKDLESRQSQVKLKHQLEETFSRNDYILNVEVVNKNSEIALPVLRAEKRYFMLNYQGSTKEKWGIISDVILQNGATIVTLRSILTVYNHFQQPIEIYYMTEKGNEVKLLSTIKPNEHYNVPIDAVYCPTNELFFAVEGFSITNSPYVWKDLKTNLTVTKLLQCSPRVTDLGVESFIIKAVGEMEQVYYENTTRHTMNSTGYNIHLRPAVMFTNCLPLNIELTIEERNEEVIISPGETSTLRYAVPGKTAVVVRLPDYLEKEWICRSEILDANEEFTVWSFNTYEGDVKRVLELGVHFVHCRGSLRLMLYCPFWMLNKTGFMLGYRNSDDANILHHPPSFKGPILFSFTAKNFFGKKKASICIDQGKWSEKFSLDVAGSSGTVICESNDQKYQIGVHNQLTYNGLTKQITFTPYNVVMNNASFAIDFQEFDRPGDPWVTVEPKSCAALWPLSDKEDKCLRLRVHGTDDLTPHFLYTESHTTLLRTNNCYGGISVDVQLTEGAVYVNLGHYESGMAPAMIMNHTSQDIVFWEKEHIQKWSLPPKHCILYTWLNPSGPRKIVWERKDKKEMEDDLRKDGIGELEGDNETPLYWTSFLDGMQRVLLFTPDKSVAEQAQSSNTLEIVQQELTVSIQGIGLSLVNNITRQEIMYLAIASSGIIWEQCKLKSTRYKQLSEKESQILEIGYQEYLNLVAQNKDASGVKYIDAKHEVDFDKLEMYKPNKRKIRRSFQTGLWLNVKSSPTQMQVHAKINRIQIDNQMLDCLFPVILAPVLPPKSVAAESGIKPFIELSIVQLLMKNTQIKQYKYFKVLVQEFHVKIELGFINGILELFEQGELTLENEKTNFIKDTELVNENLYSHAALQSLQEQKNFYDLLHFSPLKIHISFSLSGNINSTTETDNIIKVLLQGVGVTLTDMNDVEFKLAYFEREYTFLTKKKLVSEATTHYIGQLIKQLYVLILGLDVLGNPYGLVLGITKGVEDLFYEPFQGAIQGPGEFAEGLVLGVRSLLGHTVGGAAGAVSKITGAVGKGLAALTFDKDYQRKRRDQLKKKPTSTQEHLARGGKGVVMGVFDGVSGVFTKPVTGAKEEGFEGFLKGLGKGAIGLVARPTAGIVDFASSSFDVVKRATDALEEIRRLRAPRYIPQNGHVVPFNSRDAKGQKLLYDLEKGKYAATDIFLYFEEINKKEIVLLTDKRLAYVNYNDVFGAWQIDWSFTWQELINPAKIVPKGVSITTPGGKKKLFKSGDQSIKIIPIQDSAKKDELFTKIEALRGA